jgi:tetratricopeptide (TPR) repeat protein
VASPAGVDEVEGIDEEFLFHLNRGSELLVRGEAEASKASLERALELRPKDAKVLGLLGQAYYKLSRFEDAARVWQKLVDDNPVEPAARVNLGLACLKAKRHPDAVKQLEIALDLNPEHKKAMGYLGLALLESGNLTRAREWFRKAGSDHMVARCDELIAGRAAAVQVPAAPSAQSAEAREQEEAALEPLRTPPPGATSAYRPPAEAGEVLGAWAAARLVQAPAGETFSISAGGLAVAVRGEVRVRLDGLFATQGRVTLAGEIKRFRGRPTEKPFGEGATRMHLASGDGVLLFRAGARRFTALDLGPDAAYLREEALFGFEEGIAFENGRVPSAISAELHLVHLRGRGRFLLATAGDPVTVDVSPDAPLKVPLAALVGWIGGLTPRVCPLVEDGATPAVVAVELTGKGRVIADPSAAAEA